MSLRLLGSLLLSFVALWFASAGLFSGSVDLGHHHALIRSLVFYGGSPDADVLGEMAVYPPLSHWLAALYAHIAGPTFSAMMKVGVFATLLIYVALAWGLSGLNRNAAVFFGASVVVLGLTAMHGNSLFGSELFANYLYSQVVGDALSIGCIVCLSLSKARPAEKDIAALVALAVIASCHLLPALRFAGAYGVILLVSLYSGRTVAHVLRVALFAVGGGLVLVFHPSVSAMLEVAGNDGLAQVAWQLPHAPLAILALALAVASAFVIWRSLSNDAGAAIGSMGFIVAFLALAQIAAFQFGIGNNYAVVKHFFGVVSFLLVILAALLSGRSWNGPSRPSITMALAVGSVCLLSLYANRQPMMPVKHLALASSFAQTASEFRPDVGLNLFWDKSLPPSLNYALTVADMRHPRDEDAMRILLGKVGEIGGGVAVVPFATATPAECLFQNLNNGYWKAIDIRCADRFAVTWR